MALTEAQILSTFEIVDVKYTTSVEIPVGGHGIESMTETADGGLALQTKLMARLAALSAGQQAKLIAYVAEWDALGTGSTRIDGSVGQIQGLLYDPDATRREIRRRVSYLVGIDDIRGELSRGAGNPSPFVPLIR